MKRILFILLLIVFSAQGITVAMGGDGMGVRVVAQAQAQDGAGDDTGLVDDFGSVDADMEEMSDYVAHDQAMHAVERHAPPVAVATPPLVSIDLPRAPPPPRV